LFGASHPAPNNGMQRTRNQDVFHAGLVARGGLCAALMPSVGRLLLSTGVVHQRS